MTTVWKKQPQMPSMEDEMKQTSASLSKVEDTEMWITIIDLDSAWRQVALNEKTSKHPISASGGA